jgi:hypothetical protein
MLLSATYTGHVLIGMMHKNLKLIAHFRKEAILKTFGARFIKSEIFYFRRLRPFSSKRELGRKCNTLVLASMPHDTMIFQDGANTGKIYVNQIFWWYSTACERTYNV